MRCINKKSVREFLCAVLVTVVILSGCGSLPYDMAYDTVSGVSGFNVVSGQDIRFAEPFASDLCVVHGDISASEDTPVSLDQAEAAALFDLNRREVIYAKNVHEELHPASLTKVMTALVALQNGRLDQILTATSSVNISESGAQLMGLKVGDTMTLDQALRIMLLYSANDVAMLVAEGVGGSVDNFVEMMNQEAMRLGATNTHFVNPHGLTDANHYTTAYDLYLIFNEAIKYETFSEIIHMTGYQTTYYDKNGKAKEFDKPTTNRYLKGDFQAPANVTVIGGKTGTTSAAGHCLLLLCRDVGGAPYISIILRSDDTIYDEMNELLRQISN